MICTTLLLLPTLLAQQETPAPQPKKEPTSVWELLEEKYDADGDGRITLKEHGRGEVAFKNLDRDEDGALTKADSQMGPNRKRGRRSKPEKNSKGKAVKPPVVGEVAPDFELRVLLPESAQTSEREVEKARKEQAKEKATLKIRLSSFAGEKPVALIFGSYT